MGHFLTGILIAPLVLVASASAVFAAPDQILPLPHLSSTGSVTFPGGPSLPRVDRQGSDYDAAAFRANIAAAPSGVLSDFAGDTAPVMVVQWQKWLDTSVSPRVLRQWDGSRWIPLGALDSINHTFAPLGTIASSQIPLPSPSGLGGIKVSAAGAHQFATGINGTGSLQFSQPVAADIAGLGTLATQSSLAKSQLPTLIPSDIGAAERGANASITALMGLTTPLSQGQGGTGTTTVAGEIARLGLVASATVDATNAGNISSGTLPVGRLPTSGVDAGIYGDGSHLARIMVDATGRVTGAASTAIAIAPSQVSGLANSATIDATNATNITVGTLPAAQLPSSGVTAGIYGDAAHLATLAVDGKGRVTAASTTLIGIGSSQVSGLSASATIDATNAANISAGTLPAARLPNSGVAAGTYGDGSHLPSFTIDATGRLTAATSTTIVIPSAQVSGLSPSATVDATSATNITSGTLPAGRLIGVSGAGLVGLTPIQVGAFPAGGGTLAGPLNTAYGVNAGALTVTGSQGAIFVGDRSVSGHQSALVRTGNVTALVDDQFGNVLTYTPDGATTLRNTLAVANGLSAASVSAGSVSSNGSNAALNVYDRTGDGRSSTFYRTGDVSALFDSQFGDVLTFTPSGQIAVPNSLTVGNGLNAASVVAGSLSAIGTGASLNAYDRSGSGFNTFYRIGGIGRLYDSVFGDVVQFDVTGKVSVPGTLSVAHPITTPSGFVPSYAGSPVSGHCTQWSSGGVLVDSGAACGGSGSGGTGSGTVSTGSANQLAFYPASGATVAPLSTITNGVLTTNGSGVPGFVSGANAASALGFYPTKGGALAGSLTVADTTYGFDTNVINGRVIGNSVGGCSVSDGNYLGDGSFTWVPTCSGTWLGSNPMQVPVHNITGTDGGQPYLADGTTPNPEYHCLSSKTDNKGNPYCVSWVPIKANMMAAQLFIQSVTQETTQYQSALQINMVANAGGTNEVGITDFTLQLPKADGSMAPQTWGMNPEMVCGPGSKGALCLGAEYDYANNDDPCTLDNLFGSSEACQKPMPDDHSGLHYAAWYNAVGNESQVGIDIVGIGNDHHTTTATINHARVSIAGNSSYAFSAQNTTLDVNGTLYRVAAGTQLPKRLDLTQDTGIVGTATITWGEHSFTTGIFLEGELANRVSDIESRTAAVTMLRAGSVDEQAHHHVVLDASNDTAPYGVLLGQDQQVCFTTDHDAAFNSIGSPDHCLFWSSATGRLVYQVGNVSKFSVDEAGNVYAAGSFKPNTAP